MCRFSDEIAGQEVLNIVSLCEPDTSNRPHRENVVYVLLKIDLCPMCWSSSKVHSSSCVYMYRRWDGCGGKHKRGDMHLDLGLGTSSRPLYTQHHTSIARARVIEPQVEKLTRAKSSVYVRPPRSLISSLSASSHHDMMSSYFSSMSFLRCELNILVSVAWNC